MRRLVNSLLDKLFIRCPKTGKIRKFRTGSLISRILFPSIGFASLIWFLIRVVPKPSRAGYPCMKVAAPMASGFFIWMTGLLTSVFAFHKARERFREHKYALVVAFVLLGFLGSLVMTTPTDNPARAAFLHEDITPNDPMGEPKGIFPGRVVWAYDPLATNEKCTNDPDKDDGWFMPQNNDQDIIDRMLSDVLRALTGKDDDKAAWDAVFHYNNEMRGKGDVGYQPGEIVYIKTNATSSWGGNYSTRDFSISKNNNYGIAETNPHLVLAVLRQLVNVAGVDQRDIYIGDPLKHVYKHCFELWTAEFPEITVLDNNSSKLYRHKVVPMDEAVMKYSDRGKVMHTGSWDNPNEGSPTKADKYYKIADICEYLINIPTMKGHKRAGITMFAKNHFGSHTRDNAVHLHGGLVDPTETGKYLRPERNIYRVQVDLMGHDMHYKKGLFYLMDALYSGSEATHPPRKFKMAPFNNDWTSSIFLSLDPVAIASVGFDFLRTEYDEDSKYPYPVKPGVDDYLHQAADKSEWPEDIVYDPEGDGTPIPSLGVHEHWNNPIDKEYTRNLETGEGIELYKIFTNETAVAKNENVVKNFNLHQNYPNPFNPTTTIQYDLSRPANVSMAIFNTNGQLVKSYAEKYHDGGTFTFTWNGKFADGTPAPTGVYLYQITVDDGIQLRKETKRMTLLK